MKLTIRSFLKYVEIQTKVASVIPLIFGTLYSYYRYRSFILSNFLVMFVSLITFDMATTAINNYIDFKKANKREGYGYELHNAMVRDGINERTAVTVIVVLLSIAMVFGIILTFMTSPVVLLVGIICFAIGIFYTFGPIPISRMPLGEVFSGITMGFGITFLAVFIHAYDKGIAFLSYNNTVLSLGINPVEVLSIFLISIPLTGCIANIMLANNICDLEDDIENRRFTLPYYIGRENALKLFAFLYYIGYIAIITAVIIRIEPLSALLVFMTLIPVYKNIKIFKNNPSKAQTFVLSVKNMVLVNVFYILSMAAEIVIELAL